jgi:2-hydroxychromene-2-carboxylate isomerase
LAEEQGRLRPWIVEVMRAEWARGQDIGQPEVWLEVAEEVGLDRGEVEEAMESPDRAAALAANWDFAQSLGVIGVPPFVVGEEIFWGNDRVDFLEDHLRELRLARR